MRIRAAGAVVVGMALALWLSVGFAGSNAYPVGRAALIATNFSGVTGEAIVRRQLTSGSTQVQVRAAGLPTSSAPFWKIETGAHCGTPSTATAIAETASPRVTSIGTFMTAETYSVTLPVDRGTSEMTLRIYGTWPGWTGPTELACGQVYDQPALQLGGSEHWW